MWAIGFLCVKKTVAAKTKLPGVSTTARWVNLIAAQYIMHFVELMSKECQ